MPFFENNNVSKSPVVGFGAGDIYVATGLCPEDGGAPRYLLVYQLPQGGSIGTPEETGRTDFIPEGLGTDGRPADVAFYFAKEESVDQVLAILQNIKESFAVAEGGA